MALALSIVTPSGAAFEDEVDGVVLPGSEGDFGVLPDHERFLCPLRIGEVRIERGGETLHAAIGEGFADVSGSAVSVLVETCERADAAGIEAAIGRVRERFAPAERD